MRPRSKSYKELRFFAQVNDVLLAPAVMATIDDTYRALGTSRTTFELPTGEPLRLSGSGILKVVEDMRTQPKKGADPVRWRDYDTHEDFDAEARRMTATTLYRGVSAGTRVEGPNGQVDVARRVVYLINSPSRKQLAGKESHLLGSGGSTYEIVTMPAYNVGHVRQRETRKEIVQTRIVSAEVIVPTGIRKVRAHQRVFIHNPPSLKISPAGAF